MNIISVLEQEQLRKDIPDFRPGDTVKVHVKVVEGNRERIQVFEGVVIGRQNGGVRETFTVRHRCRTYISCTFAPSCKNRSISPRDCSSRETSLLARTYRQSCPYSRTPIKRSEKDSRQGVFFCVCL